MGSIIIDDKKAISSLKQQEKMAKAVSASYKQFGDDVAKVGKVVAVGLAAATAATTALVVKFTEVTSEIADNSKKVNMSAKEYQKWTYAAKQSGMEQETLISLMKKQQTSFAQATNGAKKQAEAYRKLGIDVSKLTGEQGFEAAIRALADMEDETQRNAIANDIFGKSYADLMPLLQEGADGIDALRQRAEELGIVLSDEAVAAGDKFGDTMDDLKAIFGAIGMELAETLVPYLQDFADWVIAHKEDIKAFAEGAITKLGDALKKVADWLFDITSDPEKSKKAFDDIKNFFVWFTSAAFVASLMTHPLITIVTALGTMMAFRTQFADFYNKLTPSQQLISKLGSLALVVGGLWVAITGGAAAITIGAGLAALGLAMAAITEQAEAAVKAPAMAEVGKSVAGTNFNSGYKGYWDYTPVAQTNKTSTTQDIANAVVSGLKKVKVVLDDKQVGTFVDDRIINSTNIR